MPLSLSEEKPEITKFLTNNPVGVLATVDADGQPHAAAIYFTIDTDMSIYFITKDKTTKFQNLQGNSKVSMVVYEPTSQSTVQLIGTVSESKDISRNNKVFDQILKGFRQAQQLHRINYQSCHEEA